MSHVPLMPKATAVWLLENTALTFEQISDFCHLHILEIKAIADGDVASGIKGLDPIVSGKLSRDELERAAADPTYRLSLTQSKVALPPSKKKKSPKYTPLSKRQDRPDAIAWILKHYPALPESAIVSLLGTTKSTIQAVRDRSHWNAANIKPSDPVLLGLCSQGDLDSAARKALAQASSARKKGGSSSASLRPAGHILGHAYAEEEGNETDREDGLEEDHPPETQSP